LSSCRRTWHARGGAWSFLVLGLIGAACAELPEIEKGECGNGVIEENAGEDCDSFAWRGASCRSPGSEGQCHLDCSEREDGKRAPCPPGWGCELRTSLCRAPSDDFVDSPIFAIGNAHTLLAADFDADGRSELLSREPQSGGFATLQFHYFDERGMLAESKSFPKHLLSPSIVDADKDGPQDVLINDGRIGLLRGREDRSWVPESFGTYVLPGAAARTVSVHDELLEPDMIALVAIVRVGDEIGFFVPDPVEAELIELRRFAPRSAELIGDAVGGNLLEDPFSAPCREVAFVTSLAEAVTVVNPCVLDDDHKLRWRTRDTLEVREVTLSPPRIITHAPLIADVNADGHNDLLIGTASELYVAFGDGRALAQAVPFPIHTGNPNFAEVMPLAVRDLDGNGKPDFIFPNHVVVANGEDAPGDSEYLVADMIPGEPWTSVQFGDLDANGHEDIVLASSSRRNIDFFSGRGKGSFLGLKIPTSGVVKHLAVGDFDGDGFDDLALLSKAARSESAVNLMMSFGRPAELPKLQLISELRSVESLTTLRDASFSGLSMSSTERVNGEDRAVVTLMGGSFDRMPLCFYELTEFGSDRSLDPSVAVSAVAGEFGDQPGTDVIALGVAQFPREGEPVFGFWMLEDFVNATASPTRLTGALDSRFSPFFGSGFEADAPVASVSADFKNEGRDRAVFALPTRDGSGCGLVFVGYGKPKTAVLSPAGPVLLDQDCPRPELLAHDVDGDDWVDLLLLTGSPDSTRRTLSVLWNHDGDFSANAVTRVNSEGDAPRAFTVLPRTPEQGLRIAYVDARGLKFVASTVGQNLSDPVSIRENTDATSVVAGDFNGDGLADLAVAIGDNIQVLRTQLMVTP